MKNLLLLLLLFFSVGNLFSQKYSKKKNRKHYLKVRESKIKGTVIVSMDTIFNKGIPYAILKEKKQIPCSIFDIYSLTNVNLATIQTMISINGEKTPYYAFMFTESDNVAEIEKYYGFNMAKEIVENALVVNNQIDVYNETKFLIKYPGRFSDTTIKRYITDEPGENDINTSNIYETVKRNRESEFYFKEGKIIQDYKMIGRYKIIDSTIRFYLPNGIMVAEATEKENEKNSWLTMSFKDRKNRLVLSVGNEPVTDLLKYLLENLYL